jgi:hypothetical protein
MNAPGLNQPLYIPPFDHRGSFETKTLAGTTPFLQVQVLRGARFLKLARQRNRT